MAHHLQRLDQHAAFPADAGRVCFADEAAIDFPSVRAAVARICDALTAASETGPLEVAVTLSRGDAFARARGRPVAAAAPDVCGVRRAWRGLGRIRAGRAPGRATPSNRTT